MRKLLIVAVGLLGAVGQLFGQAKQEQKKNEITEQEAAKTMDRQQVLTNYLQIIGKNLTNNDKGIELNANLFALLPKDSVSKYKSEYYLKHTWLRNTQVSIGGGIDKNSKFNAFSTGIKYNLLNKRDPSTINIYERLSYAPNFIKNLQLINLIREDALKNYHQNKKNGILLALKDDAATCYEIKNTDMLLETVLSSLAEKNKQILRKNASFKKAFSVFRNHVSLGITDTSKRFNSGEDADKCLDSLSDNITCFCYTSPLNDALNADINTGINADSKPKNTIETVDDDEFDALITAINAGIKARKSELGGETIGQVYSKLDLAYQVEIRSIARKPLLALSYNYNYSPEGIKHQHIPKLEFLVGLSKKDAHQSWELNLTATDTLATDTSGISKSLNRNIANFQAGVNRILFTDNASVSLLEAKLALEESIVLSGRYKDEKRDAFFANLTLQGRPSAKSPWLKLVLKYNKDAHFLGFIDVTFNLDNKSK